MPIRLKKGGDVTHHVTKEEKEREASESAEYTQRNIMRNVFLTPPDQLKDLLLGIQLYHTVLPDVFEENQTPRTVKVGAGRFPGVDDDDQALQLEISAAAAASAAASVAASASSAPEEEKGEGEGEREATPEAVSTETAPTSSSAKAEVVEAVPTVLQRIRLLHSTNGRFKSSLLREDFLSLISESEQRTATARTGGSSSIDLEPRGLRETIAWAINFVDQCVDPLTSLFAVEEQVHGFLDERKRVAERFRNAFTRDANDDDELARYFIETLDTGPGGAHNNAHDLGTHGAIVEGDEEDDEAPRRRSPKPPLGRRKVQQTQQAPPNNRSPRTNKIAGTTSDHGNKANNLSSSGNLSISTSSQHLQAPGRHFSIISAKIGESVQHHQPASSPSHRRTSFGGSGSSSPTQSRAGGPASPRAGSISMCLKRGSILGTSSAEDGSNSSSGAFAFSSALSKRLDVILSDRTETFEKAITAGGHSQSSKQAGRRSSSVGLARRPSAISSSAINASLAAATAAATSRRTGSSPGTSSTTQLLSHTPSTSSIMAKKPSVSNFSRVSSRSDMESTEGLKKASSTRSVGPSMISPQQVPTLDFGTLETGGELTETVTDTATGEGPETLSERGSNNFPADEGEAAKGKSGSGALKDTKIAPVPPRKGATPRQRYARASARDYTGPIVYSNTVRDVGDAGVGDKARDDDATQRAKEAANKQTKRFEVQLAQTMQTFSDRVARLEMLCGRVKKGAARVRATSERVVKRFAVFDARVKHESQVLRQIIADKNFENPETIRASMHYMHIETHNAMSDIKMMEIKVKAIRNWQCLAHLSAHKWFLDFLPKLKDIVHRSPPGSTGYSISSVKFLSVLQNVLMRGWPLDADLFFTLVDCIPGSEHCISMVHRVVSAVRESVGSALDVSQGGSPTRPPSGGNSQQNSSDSANLSPSRLPRYGVTPRQFLRYLESRGITPSPELTAEIRLHKKKKIRERENSRLIQSGRSARASMRASMRMGSVMGSIMSSVGEDSTSASTSSPATTDDEAAMAALAAARVAKIFAPKVDRNARNESGGARTLRPSVSFANTVADDDDDDTSQAPPSPPKMIKPESSPLPRIQYDEEDSWTDDGWNTA